jgi:hypothetical protein
VSSAIVASTPPLEDLTRVEPGKCIRNSTMMNGICRRLRGWHRRLGALYDKKDQLGQMHVDTQFSSCQLTISPMQKLRAAADGQAMRENPSAAHG